MMFVRKPRFDVVSCKCGTAFTPETGDYLFYKFLDDNPFEVEKIWTRCPTCDSLNEVICIGKIDITSSEDKGGE